MATAVEVVSVSKNFRLFQEKYTSLKEKVIHFGKVPHEVFPALTDISFEVEQGVTLGLLGHNGSGKSTLLKCIAGILTPSQGEIRIRGRIAAMLELGAGFHPDLSGRANIYLNAALMGLSRKEVDVRFDDIVEFSELGGFIDNQVKFYSSGMYARLGFAVAVNMDPDILLVDEVLAVGDANFQLKCLAKIREFQEEGRTIIFVSHSPDLVRAVCSTAFVLDHGRLVGQGPTAEAVALLQKFQLSGSGLNHDPSTEDHRLEAAISRDIHLNALMINGIDADRGVELQTMSQVELAIVIEEVASLAGACHVEVLIYSAAGVALIRAHTREMDLEPILVRGTVETVIQFGSLPLAVGSYSLQVNLYHPHSGMMVESRRWDNAVMVVGGQKGVSGVIAAEANVFVNEVSSRHFL